MNQIQRNVNNLLTMNDMELTPTFPHVLVVADCPFCEEMLPHEMVDKFWSQQKQYQIRVLCCLNCKQKHSESLSQGDTDF
ncbi:MAG: hypothetical protein H6510_16870 [Acidobacteria bacterium]|nr:hypothetical protein [Acidobacteriota bacterium]